MSFDYDLPDGWQWKTIAQIQESEKGSTITGPFGSSIGKKFFVEQGIPVIRGNNLSLSMIPFIDDGFVFVSEAKAEELKRYKSKADDLLFTAAGTIGQVGIIPHDTKYPEYIISNKQLRARVNTDTVDPLYAYYWFSSKPMVKYIKRQDTGSTIPLINLGVLRALPIPIPSKSTQVQIRTVLESFDKKIVLNTQTNQTLEEIAQAIFKSWFVDFDPVKAKMRGEQPEGMDAATASLFPEKLVESELGLIPEGWEVKPLGDVSTFQNGFAFKSKELTTDASAGTHKVFKMGNIRKGGGFKRHGSKDHFDINLNPKVERYLIKKGDLLMSMTDMKNNVALLGHTALMPVSDEFLVNQRVGLIRKSDKHYLNYPFLYYQTNEPLFLTDIRSRANSGVQVNLSTKGIKDTLLVVPSKEIHEAFDKQARSYLEMMFSNDAQSEELAKLRDLLLPKLLSGEIDLGSEK